MSPFQVLSVIACCVAMFAAVVAFLTSQGVPLLGAFLVVYLFAVACMLGMQRRARASCEDIELGLRDRGDVGESEAESDGDAARGGTQNDERARGYAASGLRESFRTGA